MVGLCFSVPSTLKLNPLSEAEEMTVGSDSKMCDITAPFPLSPATCIPLLLSYPYPLCLFGEGTPPWLAIDLVLGVPVHLYPLRLRDAGFPPSQQQGAGWGCWGGQRGIMTQPGACGSVVAPHPLLFFNTMPLTLLFYFTFFLLFVSNKM